MDILPVGDDVLPGTDRRKGRRTKKSVNFKDTYWHLVNALAISSLSGGLELTFLAMSN